MQYQTVLDLWNCVSALVGKQIYHLSLMGISSTCEQQAIVLQKKAMSLTSYTNPS